MLTKSQKRWNEKLIKALRSGKYKQTRGTLNRVKEDTDSSRPVGFCCLGVACDISKLGEWKPSSIDDHDRMEYVSGGEIPSSISANPLVQKLFGFNNPTGHSLPYKGNTAAMMTLNDQFEESFKQIALRLERWLAKQEIV